MPRAGVIGWNGGVGGAYLAGTGWCGYPGKGEFSLKEWLLA